MPGRHKFGHYMRMKYFGCFILVGSVHERDYLEASFDTCYEGIDPLLNAVLLEIVFAA